MAEDMGWKLLGGFIMKQVRGSNSGQKCEWAMGDHSKGMVRPKAPDRPSLHMPGCRYKSINSGLHTISLNIYNLNTADLPWLPPRLIFTSNLRDSMDLLEQRNVSSWTWNRTILLDSPGSLFMSFFFFFYSGFPSTYKCL